MGVEEEAKFGKSGRLRSKVYRIVRSNLLVIFLILGMITGLAVGFAIRRYHPDFTKDRRKKMYLAFAGTLFINMLKMIMLPLLFSSLVAGMSSLPSQAAGRLGRRAVAYYMLTTVLAVLLGILLVTTIKPGDLIDNISVRKARDTVRKTEDSILDLVRNMFPPNLVQACFKQRKTIYPKVSIPGFNGTEEELLELRFEAFNVSWNDGTNILGIVLFSIVLGIVIGQLREGGRLLVDFFNQLQHACISIVTLIIWFSPIGVVFILSSKVVDMEDPARDFGKLGFYMMTVLIGLGIHFFLFLPGIYFLLTRKNPFRLMSHMVEAFLTAWSTASSSATLPVTLKCIEEKAGVHKTVSRFVIPVGATINMDGTALYEAVAAIFIAQYNDIHLDAGQVVTTAVTATLAAIGAAGIPEGGLVTMVIVLSAVGLPVNDVALIYTIDWLLDRFRTATNVWGDSVGAGIVAHLSRNDIPTDDDDDDGDDKTSLTLPDQNHHSPTEAVNGVYVVDNQKMPDYNDAVVVTTF